MSPRWFGIITLFFLSASSVWAQDAKNPLRFVPSQAEWVVKIDRPRALLDAVEKNELFQQAQKLAGVREFYDSTNFQQLYQLIAYFEKELGKSRDEILDDLGAGGIVLGAKLTPPQGVLLVIQSKDEAKLRRFLDLALGLLQKELDRQESKDKLIRSKYEGYDVGKFGKNLTYAIADGALLVANEGKVLQAALDLHAKKKDHASVLQVPKFIEASKAVPAKALVWTWLNLEQARKDNGFKSGLDASSLDPFQMVLFGGLTDTLKRAAYITAALTPEGAAGYRLSIAMPTGREAMSPIKHMILPADNVGTYPPLQVPRTLASTSFFFDLGQLWDKRVAIFGKQNADGLDEGDKNIAKFLGGIKLGKLFNAMGPHHRLVVAQQTEKPYKIKPITRYPAVALVVDMRDPSFAKDMNSILRSGALLATFAIGLHLKEETYNGCDIVSYHFSETKKYDGDTDGIRFNFTPSYVAVGDQFVMSATAELARDLIDVLKAEQTRTPSRASMQTKVYASGLTNLYNLNQDATLTQLILSQALPPKTAKEELRAIMNWVERLGTLGIEMNYGASDFRYEILWQPKQK